MTEAAFSPLLTYITLGLEVNPDAMAAYIAENGDGYYNDEGQLLFPYDGLDVFSDYLFSLSLVDGEGKELFPDHYGNNGMGNAVGRVHLPLHREHAGRIVAGPRGRRPG